MFGRIGLGLGDGLARAGAVYCGDEGLDLCWRFFPELFFNATAHIDGVGIEHLDDRADIFGRESACDDDGRQVFEGTGAF